MSRLPSERHSGAWQRPMVEAVNSVASRESTLAVVFRVFQDWKQSTPIAADVSERGLLEIEQRNAGAVRAMHDSLTEAEQMMVLRFFLTAVHRNASLSSRFLPSILASPERQAAVRAEFESVNDELKELIDDVTRLHAERLSDLAIAQTEDLLWSMAWWVHARRDVQSFVSVSARQAELQTLMWLGREPDARDYVASGIYEGAVQSAAHLEQWRVTGALPDTRRPRSGMRRELSRDMHGVGDVHL